MTGVSTNNELSEDAAARVPSFELDDEAEPVSGRVGWEHSYGANGQSGIARRPLREPRASHVYFVIRERTNRAAMLIQTSDTTWAAYNTYGGTCMYGGFGSRWCDSGAPRSYVASYNRPLVTRDYRSINSPFGAEYPLIRFMERNGYDVAYQSGTDTHTRGVPSPTRVFLSVGHDEYWSGPQRSKVEAARDERGVNLAFFSGNEVYWRVRWGEEHPSEDGPRTMICYKESHASQRIDPKRDEWTGVWRDGRSINPLGPQPENALTGQVYVVDTWANFPVIVPPRFCRHRFWRHTRVAEQQQQSGVVSEVEEGGVVLMKGLVGHEFDEDIDNGFRPAGLMRLSHTEVDNVVMLKDHSKTFDSGSATHRLVMYRAQKSGALVFGAGTCQWSWGLDPYHDSPAGVPPHVANPYVTRVGKDLSSPDPVVQQATVNLFADMGVRPATPLPFLRFDDVADDSDKVHHAGPVAVVTAVAARGRDNGATAGERLAAGAAVTVTGTASLPEHSPAGMVAAVEVSVDGGTSWHPAEGTGEQGQLGRWRYSAHTAPDPDRHQVLCRAVDDRGVIGAVCAAAAAKL
jgi:hypothetical protein